MAYAYPREIYGVKIFYVLLAIGAAIIFGMFFTAVVVGLGFILLDVLTTIPQRKYADLPMDVHTTLFGAVIMTLAFGFWAGAVVGIAGRIIVRGMMGALELREFIALAGILAGVAVASSFPTMQIFWLGLLAAAAYNLVTLLYIPMGTSIGRGIVYPLTSLAANIVLFKIFGELVVSVLA